MRKFVWGLVALAGVAAVANSANARERRLLFLSWEDGRGYSQQQYAQPQQQYYQEQRPNMFQRMWEMEQQKNAWLRQTFMGR